MIPLVVFEVRALGKDDAGDLFRLRCAALRDSPLAFSASPEDDLASSEAAASELLQSEGGSVFGAFAPALVGMIGLYRMPKRKMAHKVGLWGLFVLPEYRKQGIAVGLLQAAVHKARSLRGVESIHLSVTESSVAALRLYEKLGFSTWGIEPNAIRVKERAENERHMLLVINRL